MSNYTIGPDLYIGFGTPIMYDTFFFYEYSNVPDVINQYMQSINEFCFVNSTALDLDKDVHEQVLFHCILSYL